VIKAPEKIYHAFNQPAYELLYINNIEIEITSEITRNGEPMMENTGTM
jgi:hypothetical protein